MNITKILTKLSIATSVLIMAIANPAEAALITFDDIIAGQTSYSYDGDNDGIDDVVFSTSDIFGFNTVGPGVNMSFINEPGIEGTALLDPDLRVDFLFGAKDFLKFGFARNTDTENTFANFTVYDADDNVLVSASETGQFTFPDGTNPSNFPEGVVDVSFSGIASYALFNFTGDGTRYIIDNFEGTFGNSEVNPNPVPEPASMLGLLVVSSLGLGSLKRKQK